MKTHSSKTINPNAPVKIKQTITINAPVMKVWKIMIDVNNWKIWQNEISSSKINGDFKQGTTFDWKSGGLNIRSTLQTVLSFTKIGWTGKAFGASAIHTWFFLEMNGSTTVTVEESMEGWLVSLMKNKFQSGLTKATNNWLNNLKHHAED